MLEAIGAVGARGAVAADFADGGLVGLPGDGVEVGPAVAAAVREDGGVGGEEEALARLLAPRLRSN